MIPTLPTGSRIEPLPYAPTPDEARIIALANDLIRQIDAKYGDERGRIPETPAYRDVRRQRDYAQGAIDLIYATRNVEYLVVSE